MATFTGTQRNDDLAGTAGDDELAGGDGVDRLAGGAGNDTLSGDAGNDRLDGGAGVDVVRLAGRLADYELRLGQPGWNLRDTNLRDGNDGVDQLANVERLFFAASGDWLLLVPNAAPHDLQLAATSVAENAAGAAIGAVTVSDADDAVHTIVVSDARFEVAGGLLKLRDGIALDHEAEPTVTLVLAASDPWGASVSRSFVIDVTDVPETNVILGTDGPDVLLGTAQPDEIHALAGNDLVDAGDGNDTVLGGAGSDDLVGQGGDDLIEGEAGNDRIVAGAGHDTVVGGDDQDFVTLRVRAPASLDTAYGGRADGTDNVASDVLVLADGPGDATGTPVRVVLDFSVPAGQDQLLSVDGAAETRVQSGFDFVTTRTAEQHGALGAQSLWLDVTGHDGGQHFQGSANGDRFDGRGGQDLLEGAGGDDTLAGGPGNDHLWGNAGADTFRFAPGDGLDVVNDFRLAEGDQLDLAAWFGGTRPAGALDDFVQLTPDGTGMTLSVRPGGSGAFTPVAQLAGVSGLTVHDLDAAGALDLGTSTGWGLRSLQTLSFSTLGDNTWGLALDAAGGILLAGTANFQRNGYDGDFALARFHADGTLDTAFGSGGFTLTSLSGGRDAGRALAVQDDGRILVGGTTDGQSRDIAVARYLADGTLDASYGTGGFVTSSHSGGEDNGLGMALRANGGAVVAGFGEPNGRDFLLAGYDVQGALDAGWGSGGTVLTHVADGEDVAMDVAVQPDGRVVAMGYVFENGSRQLAVARYLADGTLDASFGSGGIARHGFGGAIDTAYRIVVQPDGKLLVAGLSNTAGNVDSALLRLHDDGSLDAGFGNNGRAVVSLAPGADGFFGVAVQGDGRIVAAGFAETGGFDALVARFTADGQLDTAFSDDGWLTLAVGAGDDMATGVVLAGDDQAPDIVINGTTRGPVDDDVFVAILGQGAVPPL